MLAAALTWLVGFTRKMWENEREEDEKEKRKRQCSVCLCVMHVIHFLV